jgi:ATP-dependent RNA helicase DeaD
MNTSSEFLGLGLPEPLVRALADIGYESPSPIQAACIPLLLEGRDLLGQAQTGTGKTAAFALPLLARIDVADTRPQLLVLTPTRELAIQVAEAMQAYARFLPDFHVLPVYGGQGFTAQLRQLRRGAQVVVGTPGRVMDHMRRGTLSLDALRALVLDEADEMLRMGFIDDVEWILGHTPAERQVALFSATMPAVIRAVAERHLRDPQTVRIEAKTTTAPNIRQRYWSVSGLHKLDALTRLFETETFDGVIVFVRTKTATVELAEKLSARGFASEALNGDIPQVQREKTVERLRDGRLDILVATDVAARGLDVQRITHVVNYDIPYDTESYVHRIGRTGRAGRSGEAILFVAPREHRMLRAIEKATGQRVESMQMPSARHINAARIERFKGRILDVLEGGGDLSIYYRLVSEVEQEGDIDPLQIAAALASLLQGDEPLLLDEREPEARPTRPPRPGREPRGDGDARDARGPRRERSEPRREPRPLKDAPDVPMERFRLAVGYRHGVKPGNIVGAIANEAELESRYIGHIDIQDDYTLVDLPAGMPEETFETLRNAWVCGRKLGLERVVAGQPPSAAKPKPKPRKGGKAGKVEGRKDPARKGFKKRSPKPE